MNHYTFSVQTHWIKMLVSHSDNKIISSGPDQVLRPLPPEYKMEEWFQHFWADSVIMEWWE